MHNKKFAVAQINFKNELRGFSWTKMDELCQSIPDILLDLQKIKQNWGRGREERGFKSTTDEIYKPILPWLDT